MVGREKVVNYGGFNEWLQVGIKAGWVTNTHCSTHDGIAMTPEEEAEFEDGGDPCIHVLRLCHDRAEREAALAHSRWAS